MVDGGYAGRRYITRKDAGSSWNFCREIIEPESSDDTSYSASSSNISDYKDDGEEWKDEDDACVTDMVGNRLLPINSLCQKLRKNLCCKKCAVHNHRKEISKFLSFARDYEEKAKIEESESLFGSKVERLEFRCARQKTVDQLYAMWCGGRNEVMEDLICSEVVISEETYGFATSLYCRCKRERKPHSFDVLAKRVNPVNQKAFHGNARVQLYALNYQLAAAIQQMGCGPTDSIKLSGFLEMGCGDKIERNLAKIEKVIGPMQEELRIESEMEAVNEELKAMESNGETIEYHECKVLGYEHKPLPKIKVSYGKSIKIC